MPRYARIHVTGGLFHVISRFHDHRFYLDIEGAREQYLKLLGNALKTHDARVIAYCLMSSHVHLVLQLGNDALGTLTKKVHAPFANWLNARRGGLGTVLADRPKSVLVHSDTYGLELIRYVHNNPVRAGVVDRATDSSWTSHRSYLGLEACPAWLSTEAVLGPDIAEHERVRQELAGYVDEGRSEARRPEFSGEISSSLGRRMRRMMGGDVILSYPVVGPDDFVVEALREQVRRREAQHKRVSCELGVENLIKEVFERQQIDPALAGKRNRQKKVARARALAAWLWSERMGRAQVMIADALSVRASAVSRMLASLRAGGLKAEEEQLLEAVLKAVTTNAGSVVPDEIAQPRNMAPKVIVLKKIRKG
jgi:REP element-mobilizing transposase RayT